MVELTATATSANFDPYIYILDADGCDSGDAIACDKTLSNGSTSITLDDVSPGTYFIGLSTTKAIAPGEGSASLTLTVTPINPLVIVSAGEVCEQGVNPGSNFLAFGDFNGDGEPDGLSIADGERVTLIQEVCGNGVARLNEVCDDGNTSNNDDCLNSCELNTCGDGHLNEGVEECDDGNDVDNDECNNNCQRPVCGNNILEFDEECDDGNTDADDACTDTCKIAVCGDNITRTDIAEGEEGYEYCDDGNDRDKDGCFNCQVDTSIHFEPFDGGSFLIGEMSGDRKDSPTPSSTWASS